MAIDDREFDLFVGTHGPELIRVAYAVTGDLGFAEDVVQTALAKLFLRWHRVDDPLSYARKMTVNGCRDRWRRRSNREQVQHEFPDTGWAGHEDATVDRHVLFNALLKLPHKQRAVVVLRHWVGLSEADTAAVMGIAPGTVKSHLSRGLSAMRTALGTEYAPRSG